MQTNISTKIEPHVNNDFTIIISNHYLKINSNIDNCIETYVAVLSSGYLYLE